MENKYRNLFKQPGEPLVVILIIAIILGTAFTAGVAFMQKEVSIVDGENEINFSTFSNTVNSALSRKGIDLHEKDQITPEIDSRLERTNTIVINRAVPVKIYTAGSWQEVWTAKGNVAEFLAEVDIDLAEGDKVSPGLDEKIKADMEVQIVRVDTEIVTEEVVVPYSTIRETNPTLAKGLTKVVQAGQEGTRENTLQIIYEDGVKVAENMVSSKTLAAGQSKIIEVGASTLISSREGTSLRFSRAMEMEVTAYCPGTLEAGCPHDSNGHSHCVGEFNDGYTYTGVKAIAGSGTEEDPHLVAVDPNRIPLKSYLYIDGYGIAKAVDIGSAINGNSLDLMFSTHSEAERFGRQRLTAYILPK